MGYKESVLRHFVATIRCSVAKPRPLVIGNEKIFTDLGAMRSALESDFRSVTLLSKRGVRVEFCYYLR